MIERLDVLREKLKDESVRMTSNPEDVPAALAWLALNDDQIKEVLDAVAKTMKCTTQQLVDYMIEGETRDPLAPEGSCGMRNPARTNFCVRQHEHTGPHTNDAEWAMQ